MFLLSYFRITIIYNLIWSTRAIFTDFDILNAFGDDFDIKCLSLNSVNSYIRNESLHYRMKQNLNESGTGIFSNFGKNLDLLIDL